MSFREKSAWAMGAVMLLTGLLYLQLVLRLPPDAPALAQLGPLIAFVVAVTVLSVVVQTVLAILNRRDAQRPADERERLAIHKAGHWAGIVLVVVAIKGVAFYLWQGNGNWLFEWLVGGIIVSQFADYVLQIAFFRRGA